MMKPNCPHQHAVGPSILRSGLVPGDHSDQAHVARLQCHVSSSPPAHVSWYRGDTRLELASTQETVCVN